MLELGREELPQRIDAAEKAIYRRLEELKNAASASTKSLERIRGKERRIGGISRT
jgi:hypothetical protein